jgi:para-aminobenzoate synthetase
MRLLLIDNYDSYTYNLYQLLAQVCSAQVEVLFNDDERLGGLTPATFDAVVISPGPGRPQHPADLGWCHDLLARHGELPVLGVCLGHQALAYEAGAPVLEGAPRHGHLSRIRHSGTGLFDDLPQDFLATRYHSLHVAEPLPLSLEATAWAEDGVIMALSHRQLPRWGVQFHPESVATEHGAAVVANFARLVARYRGSARLAAMPEVASCSAGGSPAARRSPAAGRVARASADGGPRRQLRVSVATIDRAIDGYRIFAELYSASPFSFWLDSSKTGDGAGRFSFLGDVSGPESELLSYQVGAGGVQVSRGSWQTSEAGSIFDVLERRLSGLAVTGDNLPFDFTGGYVGYFGYETKADLGGANAHASRAPDALWMFADRLVAIDHRDQVTYLLAVHPPTRRDSVAAWTWLREVAERLRGLPSADVRQGALTLPANADDDLLAGARLARGHDRYVADISRCIEELRRGESYEICLTNRIHLPPVADPMRFYSLLRQVNPAPYAAFLRLGAISVMSSSPERFLRIYRDATVESKPIKGTAPRSLDPKLDVELRASLASSAKTRAENLMIVDLLRNDLGRVCEVGSVHVPKYMLTESYATVHQLVSTVRGRLESSVSPVRCVRACFPGGSMTGAPKIRTMEIIDRMETEARGVYSGALGYFGLSGGADLSIVIRTAEASADEVRIGIGGAIVMDSDPEDEFAETILKSRALLHAYHLLTSRLP